MYCLDDTIVAISTALGEAAIGLVRMTGPGAREILDRLFLPVAEPLARPQEREGPGSQQPGREPASTRLCVRLEPRTLHYGTILDPATGEAVDEVLAVHMPAPRTYTRQDVVEINGHGGFVALQRIQNLCLRQGARLAEPGEFTARAFLNGRLDLAQAEAVVDIVRAKTEKSLQAAVGQLAGHLSEQVGSLRADLVDLLAHLEASLDFAEDEIPERDLDPDLSQIDTCLADLLADADRGILYRQGLRTAIVGRPNVGKSSLLNRLLRTSRAIVTDIPGTTRDTLEETLNLQGIPVVLVDTAGWATETRDPVERLGIERSRSALAQADLVLMMVDASQPLNSADHEIAALAREKPAILVGNKADLLSGTAWHPCDLLDAPCVLVSALTGEGQDKLEEAIVGAVFAGRVVATQAPLVTSPRHKAALARALEHVQAARGALQAGLSPDLVAIDLVPAISALGEITGQTASEDLIETIFSTFCIGK
jgi:tRNA modification GTPase